MRRDAAVRLRNSGLPCHPQLFRFTRPCAVLTGSHGDDNFHNDASRNRPDRGRDIPEKTRRTASADRVDACRGVCNRRKCCDLDTTHRRQCAVDEAGPALIT
jgi:hypothetical protein